jgi:GTP-binding protein
LGEPLIQTKLFVPPPRSGRVARPRLLEALDRGAGCALTLVCAPAGYGKSSLLAEWIGRRRSLTADGQSKDTPDRQSAIDHQQFGWFSVDEGDNDPVRFLGYLLAALESVQPGVGSPARALLQSPQPLPVQTVLGVLANDLQELRLPVSLVLDDFQFITHPEIHAGMRFLLAKGGNGGFGNAHFKSSTNRTPRNANPGLPGEERTLWLRLKLIADAGLVGLPNAGKSTFLAAVSAAKPKIADYPFTTLEPNLGVMDLGDEDERRPTIADVPGLIEGASSGAGLGHAFLRHVERTRVLIHVIDGSSRDPEWDHEVIREELRAHDPVLLEKPLLIAFNKLDLPAAMEAWPDFRRAREADGLTVAALSASTGDGLDAFRAHVADLLPDASELAEPPEPAGIVVHRIEAMGDGFVVEPLEAGVYRVRGARIERIAAQTNFDVEESAERFQRDLARLGVDAELRRAGIVAGDLVRIGATELEWEPDAWEGR